MSDLFEREYTVTPNNLVRVVTALVAILFVVTGFVIPFSIYYFEEGTFIALLLAILFAVILFLGSMINMAAFAI